MSDYRKGSQEHPSCLSITIPYQLISFVYQGGSSSSFPANIALLLGYVQQLFHI